MHRKYLFQEARRATFKTWVFKKDNPCSADKMAEAGFIFTGSSREPDSVQCFFCGKPLDGWEANDDPWSEHYKHAPKCEFAKMGRPQDSWTLDEFLTISEIFEKRMLESVYEIAKKEGLKLIARYQEDIKRLLKHHPKNI